MHPHDAITDQIIGAAIEVHRQYGPGLLESVYTKCLGLELVERGLSVEISKPLPLNHKGTTIERAFELDLLVEGCVIVEVKSVTKILELHVAQLLTYLRLSGLRVGLILNFNVTRLKDGIRRVINDRVEECGTQ